LTYRKVADEKGRLLFATREKKGYKSRLAREKVTSCLGLCNTDDKKNVVQKGRSGLGKGTERKEIGVYRPVQQRVPSIS